MAKSDGRKKMPHLWKSGQSGNPKGSSARSRTSAAIKRLTNEQVAEVGSLLLMGNIDGLRELAGNTEASVLQTWMAALIIKSIKTGTSQNFHVLMDRIVGRVKESVELTGAHGNPLELNMATRDMTPAEKAARADQLAAMRREVGED